MVVFEGPVYATEKRPKTEPDRTDLDRTGGCGCMLSKQRNRTDFNRLQPVTSTTGCPRDTPKKCAHFEPILKRNGSKLHELWAKQYFLEKSAFVCHLVLAFFMF